MLIKRSITINKHRTSLSLENEFWEALKKVSKIKKCSIESLITRIDLNRKTSLASSTRVFLLQFFENNYELKWVQPIDQFLFSSHVEIVGFFEISRVN